MQLDRLHVEGNIPPLNNVVLLKHLQLICRHGAGASKSPVLLSTTASADHAKASERKANERKANERKENTPSPSNQTKQTRQAGCGWRKMKMESRYDIQNCTDGSVVHFFRLASHFKANRNMARFFKPFPSGFFEFFRQARHQDNLRAIFCGSLNACCCCCCCCVCVCVCVWEREQKRALFFFPFPFALLWGVSLQHLSLSALLLCTLQCFVWFFWFLAVHQPSFSRAPSHLPFPAHSHITHSHITMFVIKRGTLSCLDFFVVTLATLPATYSHSPPVFLCSLGCACFCCFTPKQMAVRRRFSLTRSLRASPSSAMASIQSTSTL